jgi:uncharacterized protein
MIVVCNTSPLTNLAAINQFGLLEILFGEIQIANGVWEELNQGGVAWPGSNETASAGWIVCHSVKNEALVISLMRDLDRGEAESIALAVELQADLVLMDEKEGRRAAQRLGFRTLGVVGLLVEAKTRGKIELVRPQLEALRQTAGFYLSEELVQAALKAAGEN